MDNLDLFSESVEYYLGNEDLMKFSQSYIGRNEEYEHTDNPNEALRIALEHLAEDSDYYLKVIPAGNRDGYRIDFYGKYENSFNTEFYYIAFEYKSTWGMTEFDIFRNPKTNYIEDLFRSSIKNSLNKTFYKCIFGKSNKPIHNIPLFLSITNSIGYEGYHTNIWFEMKILDFLTNIYENFDIYDIATIA